MQSDSISGRLDVTVPHDNRQRRTDIEVGHRIDRVACRWIEERGVSSCKNGVGIEQIEKP
jgi:hypothetical protein